MSEDLQRRVYTLPVDLVERIDRYRARTGARSEVEAVRILLAEALDRYDDEDALSDRFVAKLALGGSLVETARQLIVGHPLVRRVELDPDAVVFWLNPSSFVRVNADGEVTKGKADK